MADKDLAHGDTEQPRTSARSGIPFEEFTGVIVDTIYKVHSGLGPGLLESVYETVLLRDLSRRGLQVDRQKSITFEYDGLTFVDAFRVDLLINASVVVEIKSVEKLIPVHSKQLLTYLRLMRLPVGFLMNFGAPTMKLGLHRIVNGSVPLAAPCLRVNQADIASAEKDR